LGVVIPGYDPDLNRLCSYVKDVDATLDPATIRVEYDSPASAAAVDRVSVVADAVNAVDHRRGKGAAITQGFDALGTDRVAFADADGSTSVESLLRVVDGLDDAGFSVGSRRHPDAEMVTTQTRGRELLGDGFAVLCRLTLDVDITDFQCGAKALDREAWRRIRPHVSEHGFAWDVDVIGIADALDVPIVEVPVDWTDRPGSTVDPVYDTAALGRALVCVRRKTGRLAPESAPRHDPRGHPPEEGSSNH
jgi:hypothetical protein